MRLSKRHAVVLGFLLLGLAPSALSAQTTPADTAAVLYDLAVELEDEGRTELAQALLHLIQERYAGTPVGERVAQRLAGLRPSRPERNGRTELTVWSTLYGVWLGAAIPAAFDANDEAAYGLGLLVGAPAGFLASRAVADGGFIGEGHARTITFGGTWGTWQGWGWQRVLGLSERTENGYTTHSSSVAFTSMIVGGLAGTVLGNELGRRSSVTAGTATLTDFGALWGSYYALATAILADIDSDDTTLTMVLLGGNAGLVAMAGLGPGWNMSRPRARLINIAGVAGLIAGLGLDLVLQPDNDRVAIAIPTATSIAGLALGAASTRDHEDESLYDASRRSDAGGALIRVRDGALAWDLPTPTPTLIPVGPGGHRQSLGVRISWLDARF